MMMEARKGLMERERDQLPIGMRVLAVDDDPICLKVLMVLLRCCQYHGSTSPILVLIPSSRAAAEDPKAQPPPCVLVTYLNGAEEAFVAADGATAQGMRDQILACGRLLETEQLFREAGEKWPVVIPEE
ncbi:hypothetical protein VPH35_056596 [Triticum aestivum]|uniref:Response regulatory domain-containing protein n=2 Tax=Triticum TaxID=4564 RepID=A0A9R1SAQ2_TRITD|nr:unnamed protein product [Triticum aestivum]VAH86099.1 unnamed protein product [Triticum turgidum subsp. durum]